MFPLSNDIFSPQKKFCDTCGFKSGENSTLRTLCKSYLTIWKMGLDIEWEQSSFGFM